MSTLERALEALTRCWAVVPLHWATLDPERPCSCGKPSGECKAGKHPYGRLAPNGLHSATKDADAIRSWYTETPKLNYGIVTGRDSGVFVVDVDPRHEGDANWCKLCETHGGIPETWRVNTGSGGEHYFFRYAEGVTNARGSLPPGIDIRGDGGYVVAPGSNHESGGFYEWDAGAHPDDTPLAEAPAWLLALIRTKPPVQAQAVEGAIAEGGRNQFLTSRAGAYRRAGAGSDVLLAALLAENARCNPPLSEGEVATIAKSVARYEPESEGENGQPLDPFAGRWLKLSEAQLADTPPKRRYLLSRYEEHDIGVLPRGKAGVLAAGGGTGKTMLLCQLAVSVALERPFLGFNVTESGRVLLALAEEDAEEAQRRLWKACNALELSRDERRELGERLVVAPLAGVPVSLVESDGRGNCTQTDALAMLRANLDADAGKDWALIVLDPLSRWAGSDTEKDNAAATRFVQAVESLLTAPGLPTVLVAHHSSQASQEDGRANVRGVTGLVDGFRWVATLNKVHDGLVLKNPKTNYSKPFPEQWLAWNDDWEKGNDGTLRLAEPGEVKKFEEAAAQSKQKRKSSSASAPENETSPAMRLLDEP